MSEVTPAEIQTIYTLLTTRVPCQNAREGVAITQLAAKLVAAFAKNDDQQTPEKIDNPIVGRNREPLPSLNGNDPVTARSVGF